MSGRVWIGPEASGATFSPCGKYRYTLWRRFPSGLFDVSTQPASISEFLVFCCMNPSTADATINDPTVNRGVKWARDWGYRGFIMLNNFAYRATDPKRMKREVDSVGPENDDALRYVAGHASTIVCAWGNDGNHRGRADSVMDILEQSNSHLRCFEINKATGEPRHPLYVKNAIRLISYSRDFRKVARKHK